MRLPVAAFLALLLAGMPASHAFMCTCGAALAQQAAPVEQTSCCSEESQTKCDDCGDCEQSEPDLRNLPKCPPLAANTASAGHTMFAASQAVSTGVRLHGAKASEFAAWPRLESRPHVFRPLLV